MTPAVVALEKDNQHAKPQQAMRSASSARALVLVATAAAFCAASTPHTPRSTSPLTAEAIHPAANQPETCPPQWMPMLLGFHSGQVDGPKSPTDGDIGGALFTAPRPQSVDKLLKAAGGMAGGVMCSLLGQCDTPPAPAPTPTSTWQCNPHDGSVSRDGVVVDASVPCSWGLTAGPSSQQAAAAGTRCKGAEALAAIEKAEVTRDELQLLVVRHAEDISWSDAFAAVRTVYEKPGPVLVTLPPTPRPAAAAAPHAARVVLPNVGREQHAYLTHIVRNYDSLAERTVFMHGRAPTCGFFMVDAHHMGNHLLTNVSVLDYVQSEVDVYMPLTGRANQNLTLASIRSTFADGLSPRPRATRPVPAHPIWGDIGADQEGGGDRWLKWERNDLSRHAKEMTLQQGELSAVEMIDFGTFFQRVIGRPPPAVLYFAHGAQFAASRAAVRSTSKETYEWILELVEAGHFEVTYYLEMIWLYVLHGAPESDWEAAAVALDKAAPYLDHLAGARKLFEADTAKSGASERRSLQDGMYLDPSPEPPPSCLEGEDLWLCHAACHPVDDPIACKNKCPPLCCQEGDALWACFGACHHAADVDECKAACYSVPVCPEWWSVVKERISGSVEETEDLVTVVETAARHSYADDASLVTVEAALAQTAAYHRKPKPTPTPKPEHTPMPPPSPPPPSPKSTDTPMPPPLPPSPSPKSEDSPMPPPLPPPPVRTKPDMPMFNCRTKEMWSKEKTKWCCHHEKLGCPPAFNCRTREVWSEEKTKWCCHHEKLGCPPAFNCRTREVWSEEKTKWCCLHQKLGCPAPRPSPSPSPCKPDKHAACSKNWAPVCGPDGKTYGNPCEAKAACQLAGATKGECTSSPSPPPSSKPPCRPNPSRACIALHRPVCGPDGVTYSNSCFAEAACQLDGSTPGPC